jgi:alkaline phosphatase D
MLDERQYRDDQPCGDAVAPPVRGVRAAADAPRPDAEGVLQAGARAVADRLAAGRQRGRDDAGQDRCRSTYFTFDFWHGYPGERREILEHIRSKGIDDVVFLTGDIHTFATGDVEITEGGRRSPRRSSAARSPRPRSARATSTSAAAR